jgi:Protein of unknown function (DUF3828)
MKRRLSLLLILAMVVACARQRSDTDLVRDFVQEFYDWYVPASANSHVGLPSDIALQSRPSAFDVSLARQLKEDSDVQTKVPGEIVGLDFDPFLSAQDPCERYEVVDVHREAGNYLVSVRGVGGCEKHDDADVVAEVVSKNGAWLFTNFHYPRLSSTDLLTVLKKLRDDRH